MEGLMDDRMMGSADPFADRLLRGERVIWRGRPQQGLLLTGSDGFLIPFSLLWGGFSIFWESSVLRAPNAPIVMVLFGIPFVVIGLFLIFGRFFFDAWIRMGGFYALTDRRVLILRRQPSASFQSVSLDRLPEATLNETSNGRGTIRFGPTVQLWNNRGSGGFGSWIAALDPTPQFLAIDDAKKVFASIQERAQAGVS
jgi:hypothetical protein